MVYVSASLPWLEKTFGDTMELLEQAEEYHENGILKYLDDLIPVKRLALVNESLRITSRLSHTMAWLMSEKAILSNEKDRQEMEALIEPLEDEYYSLKPNDDLIVECPKDMIDLMDRSFELYERAIRLENMLRSKKQLRAS